MSQSSRSPRQDTLTEEILAAIDAPLTEVLAMRTACARIPSGNSVPIFFGYLMVDTYGARMSPEWVDRARDFLKRYGGQFVKIELPVAIAFCCFVGSHVRPDLSLREASNEVMQDTIVAQRASPFLRTFVRATGGSWSDFIADFQIWRPLFSNFGATLITRPTPSSIVIGDEGTHCSAMSYLSPGTFRGLIGLFEQEGEVRFETEDDTSELTIRWS